MPAIEWLTDLGLGLPGSPVVSRMATGTAALTGHRRDVEVVERSDEPVDDLRTASRL